MGNGNRQHAEEIVRRLKQSGYEAYFVGGCVRDFILGNVPGDYDIVTSALPDQVTAIFDHTCHWRKVRCCCRYCEHHPYEVAQFRSDDIYEDGRHPPRFIFSSAKEDVFRRDFTVNGLLMDPATMNS